MKDGEEKHRELCHKGEDQRKLRGDSKARVEEASNCMEFGLEGIWKLEGLPTEEEKKKLVEINQLCERKGGNEMKRNKQRDYRRDRRVMFIK